jgi:hypothetical protein
MRSRALARLLVFAGLLIFPGMSLYAAGATARAALADAIKAAKEWKPDAILTNVTSITVGEDGKGTTWFYGFYSPRSNSFLNVTAKGRMIETLNVGTGQKDRLPDDFIDSDRIMEEALKLGMKGSSPRMGLTAAAWIVNGGTEKGDVGVWLNPRSGRLIKRQAVP